MSESNIYRYELKNGLRGIHIPAPGQIAHCAVMIHAGTRDEPEKRQGLAHFIEHTLFKGTKKRKTLQVLSCLDAVGGELNAYTSKEITCIYASFTLPYLDRAADLLSDILLNSTFPEREIEKEKEVVAEEIRMYLDTPSEQVFDEFESAVFGTHPLGRNILGTEDSLARITRNDLLAFVKKHYHSGQIVLCTSGDFSKTQAMEIAERYFGTLAHRSVSRPAKPFRAYKAAAHDKHNDTHQAHCIIGAPAYSVKHKNRTALALVANVLGGPAMNSRLSLSIREKNGLAYAVEAGYTPFTDTGLFHVYFGTDPQNVARCMELVHKELRMLREKTLSPVQLSAAKRQLKGQLALAQENRLNMLLGCGKSLLVQGKILPVEKIYEAVDAVSAVQMRETANEIMNHERLSSLFLRPAKA